MFVALVSVCAMFVATLVTLIGRLSVFCSAVPVHRFVLDCSHNGLCPPRWSQVYYQVESEVRAFWHSLEAATNARQAELFNAINARVEQLSRGIEVRWLLDQAAHVMPVVHALCIQ